jgi:hypothetical protein
MVFNEEDKVNKVNNVIVEEKNIEKKLDREEIIVE